MLTPSLTAIVEPVVQLRSMGSINGASVTEGCDVPTAEALVGWREGLHVRFLEVIRTRSHEPSIFSALDDAFDELFDCVEMRLAEEDGVFS